MTEEPTPQYHLLKGIDESKDQSYFLWTLTQNQLEHILFPIGNLTKKEVRRLAEENNLPVAKRPESFEICFVANNDYRDFLRRHISKAIKPGPVVNTKGEIIGEHEGLPLYTIGQRHGFKVGGGRWDPPARSSLSLRALPSESKTGEARVGSGKFIGSKGYIPPLYVVGMDVKKNALIVGRGAESERKEFEVEDVSWVNPLSIRHPEELAVFSETAGDEGSHQNRERILRSQPAELSASGGMLAGAQNDVNCVKCEVRIRHQGELIKSKVKNLKSKVRVILDEPTRGITPGQSAVFYRSDEVLGGGVIRS